MKTAICCIAKCENRYLKEWVDYHLNLGFSHIYIWDNNNPDGEHIEEALPNYSQVTVLDCRGEKAFQNKAYTRFYKEYGKEYDWIAYIDVDEFITFSEESRLRTIDEFLNRYDAKVQIVHLNWMCYGDSGIVDSEGYSVLSRFKTPMEFEKKVKYDFPENDHVKSLYRGGLDPEELNIGPHTTSKGDFLVVDALGNPCDNSCFKPYDFSIAFIRHYVTKTLLEWIVKKSRGRVSVYSSSDYYSFDRFFMYNERTKEKERIIEYYDLFSKALGESMNTDLMLCRKKMDSLEKQFNHLRRDYQVVINSKAYKLGKLIIRPFKIFK